MRQNTDDPIVGRLYKIHQSKLHLGEFEYLSDDYEVADDGQRILMIIQMFSNSIGRGSQNTSNIARLTLLQ